MFVTWKTQPTSMGWLHILGIILMLCAMVGGSWLGTKFSGEANEKKNSKIIGFAAIYFWVLEIFSETFMSIASGKYLLTLIPFQLCSVILFVMPFIPFLKKGIVKDSLLGIIAFVSTTGAFFYFVKPTAALTTPYIIKSLLSIWWHVSMMGVCTFTMTSFDLLKKEKFRGFIASLIAYAGLALIAVAGNFILPAIDPTQETNLFYISYYNTTYSNPFQYPILGSIFGGQRPYFLYVIAFIIYFALGASACYGVGFGVKKLIEVIKAKKTSPSAE